MPTPIRILHAASEVAPLVKTGGLADVAAALPAALRRHGHDARVVLPGYRAAIAAAQKHGLSWGESPLIIEAGGIDHRVGVGTTTIDGVPTYLLGCDELYARDGVYGPSASNDYDDNARRFSVFSKAALALPGFLKWTPHIVHAHDWQSGLIPALLERGFNRALPATRSVFTIHNIAYQGAFWHFDLKLTGLDWALFNPMHLEHYGKLNLLKAGVVFADRVTTVSRRHAEEIQTAEYGYGMQAVMAGHSYKLSGITNGIDTAAWDPATDRLAPAHYDAKDLTGKRECKRLLRDECGLHQDPNTCVVGVVSRLVEQKGIDLVLDAIDPYILSGRLQLVVLGAGDLALEHRLHAMQARHPGRIFVWYGYNEGLAHRIFAGCDAFLMPSRFEPCGLTQMYALRYGTLPIVRYTGGLADTVRDVVDGQGNGFTFGPIDLGHFSSVIDRALGLYQHFPEQWRAAQSRAMAADHSWTRVAQEYVALYRSLAFVD
ncbi:MAG TPA: glycogen synthase GlgA [Planctomycetota bacterium]|nr:glycogen synthase GlgA [Planctomycetota bacterium]